MLHVGSIATVLDPGADTVLEAFRTHRGRALLSLDPNARPAITPDRTGPVARVEELVALADVVKVSDEDLHWLHPDDDPVATAARWAEAGPGLVVVTRGGAGAVAVRPGGTVLDVPGVPVAVADTVGAGDTFSGVLVDALLAHGVQRRGGCRGAPRADRPRPARGRHHRRHRRGDQRLPTRRRPADARGALRRARRGPRSRAGVSAEQIHDIGRRRAWVIWLVSLAVYVLAVFHRSSLGVAGIIASDRFDISATSLATFTVLQLVVYAGMQVPVGVLLDRYGSRAMLLAGLVLMTAGQLGFAFSTSFGGAVAARAVRRRGRRDGLRERDPARHDLVPGAAGADGHPAHRPDRAARRDRRGRPAVVPPPRARLDAHLRADLQPRRRAARRRRSRSSRTRPTGATRSSRSSSARSPSRSARCGATPARGWGCGPTSPRSSPSPSSRCCGATRSWCRASAGPRPRPARC